MSGSVRPYRLQPTRLLCPWDSPGKTVGVGCHALFVNIGIAGQKSRLRAEVLTQGRSQEWKSSLEVAKSIEKDASAQKEWRKKRGDWSSSLRLVACEGKSRDCAERERLSQVRERALADGRENILRAKLGAASMAPRTEKVSSVLAVSSQGQ